MFLNTKAIMSRFIELRFNKAQKTLMESLLSLSCQSEGNKLFQNRTPLLQPSKFDKRFAYFPKHVLTPAPIFLFNSYQSSVCKNSFLHNRTQENHATMNSR